MLVTEALMVEAAGGAMLAMEPWTTGCGCTALCYCDGGGDGGGVCRDGGRQGRTGFR